MRTEARLLGPVQLVVGDIDVTPSSVRARTFLASLLLRCGQTVPFETLSEELWGDSPPATARAQVHTYASRLRKRIDEAGGPGAGRRWVATHPVGYTLVANPQQLDLTQFTGLLDDARNRLREGQYEHAHELLRAAVELWRGPALAGVTATPRLAAQARRFEHLRLEALSLRVDAELRLGHRPRAISELRALTEEHPDHELFHTQLTQALDETNRATEAPGPFQQPPPAPVRNLQDVPYTSAQPAVEGPPNPTSPPRPAPLGPGAPNEEADPARGTLHFTVLGPVRAFLDEELLSTGSPQQRALLAALLLRGGRTATAPELVDGLWGADPPDAALAALRTYAARLRKAIGADSGVLISESGGYAIRIAPGALDLDTAERLANQAEKARQSGDRAGARELINKALDLWDGEPLAGVPGPYAETQRQRLEEWRLALIETRLDHDLELGFHAEAISELTALTAAYPLRERLRELLMLALYRSGRQAEALAVYADTRRLLADELGVDPSPTLSNLQQRILEVDTALLSSTAPQRDRLSAPSPPIPLQLPSSIPDFTGRSAFVHELSEILASPHGSVSAVSGIAGVGKTALAIRVAHNARHRFPDGQLYADLQGATPTPADPGAVLGSFLRALGTPDSAMPNGVEERAALYRSKLGGRRVLTLLDNARDAAQVRPLLPGIEGCATLVTSRTRMVDLVGAHLVDLDVMSPEEALALFTRIVGIERVGSERDAAMDVVAACGFLPLAIRISAVRLVARRTWTVSTLARRLTDKRQRLDELRAGDLVIKATFELGYGQLEAQQARAFRLLGLADGPDVSLAAAAAVLDMDDSEAEELLESLVDTSLLDSVAPGRYRYQDLVRLFARACAERDERPADRNAALSRLLDFYLATTAGVYARERPGDRLIEHLTPANHPGLDFPDDDAALDWLYVEGDCLLACAAQTASGPTLRPATDLLLIASDLAESGFHTRRYEDLAAALSAAAQACGDPRAESRARSALAHALSLRGQRKEADEQAQRAMFIGRAVEDPAVVGRLSNLRGVTAILLRRFDEAEAHLREAVDAFQADHNRPGEASALCHLSQVHIELGRTTSAIDAARQGVRIYENLGRGLRLANGKYALGQALTSAGRDAEALEALTDALNLFHESRQRLWEGMTHYRLTEIQLALRQPAEAAVHAEQSLAVGAIGGEWRRALTLTLLGKALMELGEGDRAEACWRKALSIHDELGTAEADDVRLLLDRLAQPALPTAGTAASSPPRPR
ncbi:BTAD domain-containing putative transcriptional regulator [Streptomyces solisilvae]|uniref:AfsR/SARP family transcriptional regulator n=1 Tax=Streptomyces malaysiensis TaxID=92644 RepID=UPI00367A5A45